jgi:hypothetical protein
MITKTQILHSLENLPENLTLDQVIDQLIFIEKVKKGQDDSDKGKVISKTEAKKQLNKWM